MNDKTTNIQTSIYLQGSSNIIKSTKHLSSADLSSFKQDKLRLGELEEFLDHISSCDYCSDLLAGSMESELISAPVDMKTNIINKSKHFKVQIAKRKTASKQMQLFKYSLKVISASLFAIILMFSSNKIPYIPSQDIKLAIEIPAIDTIKPSLTTSIRNNMDHFSYEILEFSNSIINTEVNKND